MSGYPTQSSDRSRGIVIAVVVAAVAGIILAVILAAVALSSVPGLGGGDAAKPPSERQAAPTTESAEGTRPEKPPEGGFEDVRCTFSGTSTLTPGLSASLFSGPSVQKMELKPGAGFRCIDEYGDSSGQVSMSAKFPGLTAFSGAGAGPGLIEWDRVPSGAPGVEVDGPRESKTTNEVEIALPSIIVWITIIHGPYAGMKGKLTLNDWELIRDIDGTITEVRFQPTDFVFGIS